THIRDHGRTAADEGEFLTLDADCGAQSLLNYEDGGISTGPLQRHDLGQPEPEAISAVSEIGRYGSFHGYETEASVQMPSLARLMSAVPSSPTLELAA